MEKLQSLLQRIKPLGVVAKASLISGINRKKGMEYLQDSLGAMPGVPAKLSQMLSMKFAEESKQGQTTVSQMDIGLVLEILQESCPELFQQMDSISSDARVASLGQVHKLILKAGEQLAIKIQFPEVELYLEQQINDFFFLASKSPAQKFGFDLDSYQEQFKKIYLAELNYMQEIKVQQQFFYCFEKNESIVIPVPNIDFSSEKVLVQSWEESIGIQEFLSKASRKDKETISEKLATFFIKSFIIQRRVHGDLHPQNWGIKLNPVKT